MTSPFRFLVRVPTLPPMIIRIDSLRNTFGPLLEATTGFIAALTEHGERIGLRQATLEKFVAAKTALAGGPGVAGSESLYDGAVSDRDAKRKVLEDVTRQARTLARLTVDVLRPHYGAVHSSQWQIVGLTRSLAIPKNPYATLVSLTSYFREHPEHAVPDLNVTPEQLELMSERLADARHSVGSAKSKAKTLMQQRDRDRSALYRLAVNLRKELSIVLPEDSADWYHFQFRRPVDGRMPMPVQDLKVMSVLPGQAQVTWSPSPRAKRYRLEWQPLAEGSNPVSVGLVTETHFYLEGLPTDQPIIVRVSARNGAGETAPAEVQLSAPNPI